jgi:hypothetical protein
MAFTSLITYESLTSVMQNQSQKTHQNSYENL